MIQRLLSCGLLLVLLTGPASAADYVLDKPHTQAQFTVTHLGLSKVNGLIPLTSGTATIGANGLPSAVSASFDVAALETYDDNRNKSLREQYFEVATYPTMTFVERSISGTPDDFRLTGDLTLHGVTKPVTLAGKVEAMQTIRGKLNIGYSATTTIDRRDFGITFFRMLDNQLIAGYPVLITIEAVAVAQ